jgi:hypothetical protein
VDLFSRFGSVVLDVVFEETKINHLLGKQSGRGFIHYPCTIEGINAAVEANRVIKNLSMNNVVYDCILSPETQEYLSIRDSHQRTSLPAPNIYEALQPSRPSVWNLSNSFSSSLSPFSHGSGEQGSFFPATYPTSSSSSTSISRHFDFKFPPDLPK